MTATTPSASLPNSDDDEALLQRVRKLFEKAKATTNPHEAEAFSHKAAELVARHRIDPERLAASAAGNPIVMRELPLGRGAYVRARLALLTTIGDHHDVRVVFKTQQTGMVAYLAGFRSDVDVVELLYHSLHQQAAAQMAVISRGTPAATQRFRRSFLMGFAHRAGDLLDETQRDADRRMDQTMVDSTAVALRERAELVNDFLEQSFGRIRSARPASSAQVSGWQAGVAAAERADVGRERIAARPALGR